MSKKPKPEQRRPKATTEAELDAAAEELARMTHDAILIPGIYNYCDRWCERCPLTARCLNFKMEQARTRRRGGPLPDDIENREFWDELAKTFALALHMIRREAKKLGVDLDDPAARAGAAADERIRRRRAAREGGALRRLSSAYRKSAIAVLDCLPEELRSTEEALNTQARLGAGNPHGEAAEIREALEVVQWYLFFIEVKLARAVAGRVDETIEGDDGFPSDADGSAKVALIAIDRSIAAWARLREQLGNEADAILDLLVQLERLRRTAEHEFPRARAFKRPGFDPD